MTMGKVNTITCRSHFTGWSLLVAINKLEQQSQTGNWKAKCKYYPPHPLLYHYHSSTVHNNGPIRLDFIHRFKNEKLYNEQHQGTTADRNGHTFWISSKGMSYNVFLTFKPVGEFQKDDHS